MINHFSYGHSSVLTAEGIMHHIITSAVSIRENLIFLFMTRNIYQQTHGQKVIVLAGAVKAPVQCILICT